jgi:trans-aconitate methyltransferase
MATAGKVLLAHTGIYLHTTLRGKLRVWERELDRVGLRGDEQLLDLGCGRGAMLIEAAKRLPTGRAVGVDLWTRAATALRSRSPTPPLPGSLTGWKCIPPT